MTGGKPAIGYARISRSDADSASLQIQREGIAAWCQATGLDLRRVHEDDGVSGGVPFGDRPGGKAAAAEAVAIARVEGSCALVTLKLDRLTRSLLDLVTMLERLPSGLRYASVSEGLDTGNPMGRFAIQIMGVFAEFERGRIAERNRDRARHNRANLVYGGGVPPFGWRPDPGHAAGRGTRALVPDPEEALCLREMVALREEGKPTQTVARLLNEQGFRRRNGTPWTGRWVGRVLRSPSFREMERAGA